MSALSSLMLFVIILSFITILLLLFILSSCVNNDKRTGYERTNPFALIYFLICFSEFVDFIAADDVCAMKSTGEDDRESDAMCLSASHIYLS